MNSENLMPLIINLFKKLRSDKKQQFNRVLSFGDYFSDRWEKAQYLGFGEGCSIYDSAIVIGNVAVGKHCWIGPGVMLDGSGGLTIGDYCSISMNVQIYSHDSVDWAISGGEKPYHYAPTSIGSRCYIGPNTVISRGISIGDGAVIGANSFVNSDVAPGSKVAGNPARVIGRSDE